MKRIIASRTFFVFISLVRTLYHNLVCSAAKCLNDDNYSPYTAFTDSLKHHWSYIYWCTIASKINVTPKGVYYFEATGAKLHYRVLQLITAFWHIWGNIYFAGDGKYSNIIMIVIYLYSQVPYRLQSIKQENADLCFYPMKSGRSLQK